MKLRLFLQLFFIATITMHAQVGIGTTSPNAGLDINSTSAGLLIPRVALTNLLIEAPVLNPQGGGILTSTLIYHDGSNAIPAGFYYWNGTQWERLITGESSDWTILGNSGTTPATNFIGTTDAQDFVIRTNNTERARVTSAGNLGVGTTVPTAKIHINQTTAVGGLLIDHSGTAGNSLEINQTDTTNASDASTIIHNGTGSGQFIHLSNTTSTGTALELVHDGLGSGLEIQINNPTNNDYGIGVFHSGTVPNIPNIYSETVSDAIVGYSTGTSGSVAEFYVDNVAANLNSIGAFIHYRGTGTTGFGGGNALELQHLGTNGNAMDVFLGNPNAAPGPANTTSEHPASVISNFATGTSPTVGLNKSAILAYNHSADPAVLVLNNGNENGGGIETYVTPNTNSTTPIAIYGNSYLNGTIFQQRRGVGIEGGGGLCGVHGIKYGSDNAFTYGVFATGDLGATGAKTFLIDHPLDPENKVLRHYSIESNEITNMYRGIVTIDATGQAQVKLPNYFDAANTQPSYQLTAIGTPIQPYILKEVTNNKFIVAGKPNTKVSWTVYAKRNDPTIRYYNNNGKNYDHEEVIKPNYLKGKYYTPEAYGKNKTQSIHYSENREKNDTEKKAFAKQQTGMTQRKKIKKSEKRESTE